MQHSLTIDMMRCVGCGCCMHECPQYVPKIVDGKCVILHEAQLRCHGCGHCVAVCPADALILDGTPEILPPCGPVRMTPEERSRLFQGRRSIRHYRQEPVPRAVLEDCLEMARYAPSGGNSQQVEWLCVDSPKILHGVIEGVIRWARKRGGFYGSMAHLYDQGHDSVLRGAPGLILAHARAESHWAAHDSSIAVSYLELALHSVGVGSCWAGLVILALKDGEDLGLVIPEGRRVEAGLLYGYPTVRYRRLPPKLPQRITYLS